MSFTNDDWFTIKDFDSFVDHTRMLTYNAYGNKNDDDVSEIESLMDMSIENRKELDNILSHSEAAEIIKLLAKKQKNKKTKKIRYIINDELYISIIQTLGDRMTSNILQGLVSKGLVEMGFDNESNDFIFWIDDKNKLEE